MSEALDTGGDRIGEDRWAPEADWERAETECMERPSARPDVPLQPTFTGILPRGSSADLYTRKQPCRADLAYEFLEGSRRMVVASINGTDVGVYAESADDVRAEVHFMQAFARELCAWHDLGLLRDGDDNEVDLLVNGLDEAAADQLIGFAIDHADIVGCLRVRFAQVKPGSLPEAGLSRLWDAASYRIQVAFVEAVEARSGFAQMDAEDRLAARLDEAMKLQARVAGLIDARKRCSEAGLIAEATAWVCAA
jgi:hypothetical protein